MVQSHRLQTYPHCPSIASHFTRKTSWLLPAAGHAHGPPSQAFRRRRPAAVTSGFPLPFITSSDVAGALHLLGLGWLHPQPRSMVGVEETPRDQCSVSVRSCSLRHSALSYQGCLTRIAVRSLQWCKIVSSAPLAAHLHSLSCMVFDCVVVPTDLFDLNGYLHIEGALSAGELASAQAAVADAIAAGKRGEAWCWNKAAEVSA